MRVAWAAGIVACFAYFSWDAVAVKFAPDDLMNIGHYWRLPAQRLTVEFLAPWLGGYRPMGVAFYLPLLHGFGLDPAPYHAVLLAILLANVFLVGRLARALGCSETTSALAALLTCYHGGLSFLYFNTSFIYDALCAFFYVAALGYYATVRSTGRPLGAKRMAIFLALHWAAWQSKEMAATLPVVVLAYEWFCRKERQYAGAVLSGVVNLPFLYGLFFAKQSFIGLSIYKPELSAARVFAFHRDSFADFFTSWHFFDLKWVLAVWAALTLLAWRRRHPVLRFCWAFFAIAPLPLELLEGRTVACLAIPFVALAIFAATTLTGFAAWVARGRRVVFAMVVAAPLIAWAVHNDRLKRELIRPQMRDLGQETWSVIRQLREIRPQVRPNSTVVFLDDPFEGFDMAFIAELWFRQPGLTIKLHKKTPFSPEELAKVDHLFTWEAGKLAQIR